MENWPEVDIVTHSMGGLLAREYIESDYYSGDIDQLVMLGTPNNGAPEAYLKWEAGAFLANFEEIFMKYYFKHEAKEKGYADLFHYIQDKIPSVKELLPTYGYLYDVENNENLLEYPADYPFNDFLDDLNSQTMKEKLWQVELDKIIGNVENNNSTVAGFKVIQTDMGEYWKHGYPHGFEIPLGDRGVKWDVGDRTVPLKSARSENIFADEVIELDFSHRELPTYAQKDVLEILTGVRPESEVRHSLIRNILLVSVYSPIDIQVEAPDGKKIGKDFETGEIINEIDGAYYTGYETDNEFLTIPNPEDGEYKILTQGTGEGDYKIEAAKISEDENNPGQTIESSKDIIGTAETGSREEKSVQVLGNEVLAEAKDTTPPDITYVVSPSPNENGWNNTDVKVHFEAADGESGMDENNASRDIILEGEGGNQSASWTTADKAGNSATKNISGINIDKTAPVTEINFSGTEGKNDWYASDVSVSFGFSDNLSGTEKTFYALDNQDFQAGNQLAVTDEGEHNLKYYSQDLAGNIENVNTADFKLDKTAPVVKIISPKNKNYPNDAFLEIKYDIEDSTSPPDKIQKTISYDDQIINSNKIDLALEHLGSHNLAISAEDEAGNQNQTQTNFTIMADINSIISNVKHYFQLGLIKSRMAETALEVKLRNIKSKTRLLNVFESRWMPKWAKDRVIANMKREINRQVDDLIGKIQNDRKFKETIDQKAKELLTEGLEYIRP